MTQIASRFIVERPHIDPEVHDTTLPTLLDVGDVIVLDDGAEESEYDISNQYSVERVTKEVSAGWGSFRVRYVVVPLDYLDQWKSKQRE